MNKLFTLSLNLEAEHNTARLLLSSNESAHPPPLKKLLIGHFVQTFFGTQDSKTSNASQCMHESLHVVQCIIPFPIKTEVQTPVSKQRGPAQQRTKAPGENNEEDKRG